MAGKYICAILVYGLVGAAVYGASLSNEFIAFDDDTLIYDNPVIRELTPASVAWIFTHYDPELYIPLTLFSYQIDYAIAGMNPLQFAVHNLVLHIFNAVLVATLFCVLTIKKRWAFLAGLLFLVHPLHTETVVWIAARKDLLSTFFFLLSTLLYARYRSEERSETSFYAASIFAFALGLLSKVSIILLPGVLLCIDVWQKRKVDRSIIIDKIPYIFLSVIFGVIAVMGKQSVLSDSSLFGGALMAVRSTMFYLQKFFVPTSLSLVYPHIGPITVFDMRFAIPLLALVFLFCAAAAVRSRFGWAAVGIIVFTLFPSFFNYAKGGDLFFASDRYAYLPSVGLLLILVLLMQRWKRCANILTAVCAAVIVIFSGMAYRQSLLWQDTYTLFSHVIDLYENTYFGHTKVAAKLIDRGEYEKAREHLNHSIDIKPTGRAYYNLGVLALMEDREDAAISFFEQAVSLHDGLPDAYMNLGYLHFLQGNAEQAIGYAEQAVQLAPSDREIARNLAGMYISVGREAEGRAILDRLD